MSKRRMFSNDIIDTDIFLDMPISTQLLYFHLAMRADDDGFVSSPKKVMKNCNCAEDDLRVLYSKKFVIPFETGVCVIRHWRLHNIIRSDRRKPTIYTDEFNSLTVDRTGTYQERQPNDNQMTTKCQPRLLDDDHDVLVDAQESISVTADITASYGDCQPNDNQMTTKCPHSIGKDRLGKNKRSINTSSFCSEPETAPNQHQEAEPVLFSIPLNDKSLFHIYQSQVDRYRELYPAVDVEQQIRGMIGWCESNPSKRKTRTGISRFIDNWLRREQDRGHGPSSKTRAGDDGWKNETSRKLNL